MQSSENSNNSRGLWNVDSESLFLHSNYESKSILDVARLISPKPLDLQHWNTPHLKGLFKHNHMQRPLSHAPSSFGARHMFLEVGRVVQLNLKKGAWPKGVWPDGLVGVTKGRNWKELSNEGCFIAVSLVDFEKQRLFHVLSLHPANSTAKHLFYVFRPPCRTRANVERIARKRSVLRGKDISEEISS